MRLLITAFTPRVIDGRQVSAETQCTCNPLPPSQSQFVWPVADCSPRVPVAKDRSMLGKASLMAEAVAS